MRRPLVSRSGIHPDLNPKSFRRSLSRLPSRSDAGVLLVPRGRTFGLFVPPGKPAETAPRPPTSPGFNASSGGLARPWPDQAPRGGRSRGAARSGLHSRGWQERGGPVREEWSQAANGEGVNPGVLQ